MQVSREDLNPCTVKLDIVCDSNEVKEGFDSAFRQLTKKVRLPGFRPGKAPRAMLEPFIGPSEWNEEAAEEMVRKVYPKAVESEGLEIDRTTMPHITINSIDRAEQKFEFTAKVPLPPKVEVGEYKGLPVTQPSAEVSDEDVEFELQKLRDRGRTHSQVTERGAESGDVAVLDLKAEGETEGKTIVTIVGQYFPDLDQAIQGMRVEEIRNVELTFPESYEKEDWAGKTLKVQITLNSLSGVSLPEVDDAFAQSMKVENVTELKNRLREVVGQTKQQMVRQMLHERLVDELMTKSEVAVSDNMWENLANRRLTELAAEQEKQGLTLEDYAHDNGMSGEELTSAWRAKAKLEVERALLIQTVFTKESMQIDNTDLSQELYTMAVEYRMDPADLLEELKRSNSVEELHFRALTRKVGDFLLANAAVSMGGEAAEAGSAEVPVSAEAAKPKKSKKVEEAELAEAPASEGPSAEAPSAEVPAKPVRKRAPKQ